MKHTIPQVFNIGLTHIRRLGHNANVILADFVVVRVAAATVATGRACGAAVTTGSPTATELIRVVAANLAVNADVASFAL
jgi:hypothetical protein